MASDSSLITSSATRKGLFSLHSIRSRLIFAISGALAALLVCCAVVILMIVDNSMVSISKDYLSRTAEYYPSYTKNSLSKEFNTCKTLK